MNKIEIYDSTLRDGAQGEGISFTVYDKINIALELDNLGISYIEVGNPVPTAKDIEFFAAASELKLKNAKFVAFGSTRRKDIPASEDEGLICLSKLPVDIVCIFGKTSKNHIEKVIKTSLEENLLMIKDSIEFLKNAGKTVFFDAEHFFDAYKENEEYALKVLLTAQESGAECISLCDTNGGSLPDFIYNTVKTVCGKIKIKVAIHTHNDSELAVANSVLAVKAGASQIQGTLLGFGERCGNASLVSVIANLQLKENYKCIPDKNLKHLTEISRKVAEISNFKIYSRYPYIGKSAFAHKAGMHIDAVTKFSDSFEHISPNSIGNERRFLVSEISGSASILNIINQIHPELTKKSEETKLIVEKIKELEFQGYQFEGAKDSLTLLINKILGIYKPFFELENYEVTSKHDNTTNTSQATITISVYGKKSVTVEEGDGPVHALDKALRKALSAFYPKIEDTHLIDYKVRVLEDRSATASKVRVLIDSTDGKKLWTTIGVSTDIIAASWIALVDSIEIKLMQDMGL